MCKTNAGTETTGSGTVAGREAPGAAVWRAVAHAAALPDVRSGKVAEARRRLLRGELATPEEIADAILSRRR